MYANISPVEDSMTGRVMAEATITISSCGIGFCAMTIAVDKTITVKTTIRKVAYPVCTVKLKIYPSNACPCIKEHVNI
jgi:hypothetical protein